MNNSCLGHQTEDRRTLQSELRHSRDIESGNRTEDMRVKGRATFLGRHIQNEMDLHRDLKVRVVIAALGEGSFMTLPLGQASGRWRPPFPQLPETECCSPNGYADADPFRMRRALDTAFGS
jgi:hypothetical protein